MFSNETPLYPNEEVAQKVTDYAYAHSTPLPQHLIDYHAEGGKHERANYMISNMQAQFQIFMAKVMGAKRAKKLPSHDASLFPIFSPLISYFQRPIILTKFPVLEIGTFIGYSTMGWASAVGPSGHVTGLEFSPEYAQLATEAFAKNNINNIEILVGDAQESIRTLIHHLHQPYDLIFIDADKSSYPAYLSLILSLSPPNSYPINVPSLSYPGSHPRLLRPGGLIIADNLLRRGLVADSSAANPWSMRNGEATWKEGDLNALKEFNDAFVGEKRIESFMLPLWDGVGLGRLRD
ncbi:O-methyltransferase family 3 protein [Rutstroemia sp. NJR-2017a WRK4]|nr:O-methyltransferase family 3 protein [Rutstroemia sp. NJR-2017a WRK4]